MCGIVGIGGANLSEPMVSFFESLLHADVVRGRHSTGVYRGAGDATEFYKDAVPSPMYLEQMGWVDLRGDNLTKYQKDQLILKSLPVPLDFSNFYVGHNRYATMGAKTATNAHPFKEGDVTLVHNGTLSMQSRLPDHTQFAVDSWNICHAINKQGIDETVQQLQGAFTLVWHDARDQTLNMIRNNQRPLFLIEFTSGSWAWASEEAMITWLNDRRKTPFKVKQSFELPVGEQYVFDVSNGGFKLKEVRKHKLPTFPTPRYVGTGSSWWYDEDYGYGSHYSTQNRSHLNHSSKVADDKTKVRTNKIDEIIKEAGFSDNYRKDKQVCFWPYDFREYKQTKQGRGAIRGWTSDENSVYLEVEVHGLTKEDFLSLPDNVECTATIIGAFMEKSESTIGAKDILVLVGTKMKPVVEDDTPPVDDDTPIDPIAEGPFNSVMDLETIDLCEISSPEEPEICEVCENEIKGTVYVLDDEATFCGTCNRHYGLHGVARDETPLSSEEEPPFEKTHKMLEKITTETKPVVTEVPVKEEVLALPLASQPEKKVLKNGWSIKKEDWEKTVGFCGFCDASLPWEDAENTPMLFKTQPCCHKHYEELMGVPNAKV